LFIVCWLVDGDGGASHHDKSIGWSLKEFALLTASFFFTCISLAEGRKNNVLVFNNSDGWKKRS
jgi:hypothetical protein